MEKVTELEKQNEELRNALQKAFNAMLDNYDNQQALDYTDLRDAEEALEKYTSLEQKIKVEVNKVLYSLEALHKYRNAIYSISAFNDLVEKIKTELDEDGQNEAVGMRVIRDYVRRIIK